MHKEIRHPGSVRRNGETKVLPGGSGQHPPVRRPPDESLLKQERFDDILDGIPVFGERGGQGFHADRASAVVPRNAA